MSDSAPDFEKPKPPKTHLTIRELRGIVIARHKMLVGIRPVDEAIALISDEYGADLDSSQHFVEWVRGAPLTDPPRRAASPVRAG